MIYAHQWLPIPAVVGALFIICAPYLALIALVVILLVAVATIAALGGAIVAGLHVLSRPVLLRVRSRVPQRSAVLSNVGPHDAELMISGAKRRNEMTCSDHHAARVVLASRKKDGIHVTASVGAGHKHGRGART
jgi:hypothetical protein